MDICTIDSSHVGSSDESMSQQQIKYSKGKTRFSIVKKIKVAAKAFYENGIIIDRVVPESVLPYFPIVLLGLAVAVCEIVSASMMFSYSGIYGAIAEGNTTAFWEMIFLSFSLSLTQACAEATKIYCRDNLALIWRRQLIEELERAANKTLFTSAHHPEQLLPPIDHYHSLDPTSLFFTHLGAVSNLDQRVTQDASELCTTAAKIVASIIVLPFVVVFYAYYLTVAIGIASPFLCLLFFLISLVVSYQFAKRVSPVIFEQGRLEGEFRLHWTQIMTQWGLITIWQGGNKEIIGSKQRFSDLWKNQRLLLWRQWKLNLVTQGFQYSGAVVTYIIVGLSVLYFMAVQESSDIEQDNDSMASKAIIRWTRGSYAAMALIHAFTTVTDAMGWYSTATGLANRVLVVFYAAKQAWTTESVSENKDSNLSDRCCCVVSTSDEYSKASSEEDNHPLKETEYNSNEKSSQLDRVYQSDPWGLWTLIEEIKRSRTIHQALTTTQSQLHSMQSPDRPSLYDRRPLGSTIQLQPWKSPISKEQSGPFATKSTPFAAALGGDDDDKSATDGTEQLLQGLHLEGAASQSEIEAGYAALFHQRMQSLPLRPHLNKGSVDAEEDLELSDDSHMQSGFLPIYDAYDYDNRFGKLSRVFEELQNRVHTSILQPIELFKVYEYSLYCPIPKCYSATDESVTHTGKTHDASQGSINAVDPPKRLLIAQLTFSMTSHMRLLISGPTGTGKSTLLFALTQQLRCMSTYAPQQSRSGFQHIVVPLQQLADRFRVLHCPQTPYVLTEVNCRIDILLRIIVFCSLLFLLGGFN